METIEGIIITEGGFPPRGYDLIFTNQRLIVVNTGITIGGGHESPFSNSEQEKERYRGLTSDQITSSFKCKWMYYYQINKAKLKKGLIASSIYVASPTMKETFIFKKKQYPEAEKVFSRFLHNFM